MLHATFWRHRKSNNLEYQGGTDVKNESSVFVANIAYQHVICRCSV